MFAPSNLLAFAQARYGEQIFVARLSSAPDTDAAQLAIAAGVWQLAKAKCSRKLGWPLPNQWPPDSVSPVDGTDCSGLNYSDVWPGDLLEHAAGLINWRTLIGKTGIGQDQRLIGQAHIDFFTRLGDGAEDLGIEGGDAASPLPFASRDRFGHNLLNDGAPDTPPFSDTFCGPGWDRVIP